MKRKISFEVTVGSVLPERECPVEHMRDVRLPVGGDLQSVELEFETDGANPMKDAEDALRDKMNGQSYHIWYWDWLL